jgi:outer membrane protein assembly factor BamB
MDLCWRGQKRTFSDNESRDLSRRGQKRTFADMARKSRFKRFIVRIRTLLPLMITFAIFGTTACGQEGAAREARWPQFRGLGGQGVAIEGQRLPTTFGLAKGLVWQAALPRGHSSPCIWDERIFVTGFDGDAKKIETICLERRSGKTLWRQPVPTAKFEKVHEVNSLASSTAACDGERVYVYFGSFGLLCYDMEGKLLWQRALEPIFTGFGSGTSPVVAGELVLLNSGKGFASLTLLALDRKTGKTVWEKDRPRGVMSSGLWSTPVVRHTASGDEVIVAGGD